MSYNDDLTGMQNALFKIFAYQPSIKNEEPSKNVDPQKNEASPNEKNMVINVNFYYNPEHYIFSSHKDEFLSSLFYKFRDKINDFKTDFKYLSSSKNLDPKKKLGEVFKNCYSNFEILVVKTNNVKGGTFSINFTDLSKQIYEEDYFADEAPEYRIVGEGINIFGICKCKKCKAYKEEVIVPLNVDKFDIIKDKDNLECPACENLIVPKTVGFHLCDYKIKGTKFENGKCIPFEFNGKAENKDSVQYFNPDKNGETTIMELMIEIIKYL